MTAIVIVNIVLVVIVVAGMLALLGRSIVADKTRVAARAGRERIPTRANAARPRRTHRGPARSFS